MKPDNTGDYVGMSAAEANAESESADTPENREAWKRKMEAHAFNVSFNRSIDYFYNLRADDLRALKAEEDADAEEDGEHPEGCECQDCVDERADDQKMRDADRKNDEAIDDELTERLR